MPRELYKLQPTLVNRKLSTLILLLLLSDLVYSQACEDIFPDGASSATNSGSITVQWQSRITGSPDGILDTTDLNDFSGGVSCDGSPCSESGSIVDDANYNTFPNNQPSISLGYQQTQTISPGDYDSISLNSEAVLTMEPGVYVVRESITIGFASEIVVGSPGTVIIYLREDFTLNSSTSVNALDGDRNVFLFTRGDVTLGSSSTFNGVIFSRGAVTMQNGASITGAVTARGDITLNSASTINYYASTVSSTEYDNWCTPTPQTLPDLVAEWRLDELSWNGGADEVQDSSGNGLHGRSVEYLGSGFPSTDFSNPVVSGDPGTCSYGDFNGTTDGYVEIQDPGANSNLDLDNEFTVAVWIYPRSWPSSGLATIVSKDENFEFHLNRSGRVNWWWGGGERVLTSSQSVPLNEWHHIAITFKSGEQHIYLDGVSIGSKSSSQAITLNNDSVFIGTDLNFHSRRFDGLIDEVKIYAGALTQTQVQTVMADTHECVLGATLDQFEIEVGGGNASVCEPYEVTLSARDSSGTVLVGYVGTVDITTSTGNGDWAIADAEGVLTTANPPDDSGTAQYSFESSGLDQGEIALTLDNQHAESLTITVSDSSASVSSTSSSITFAENAFLITENDSLDEDVIAGRRHQFSAALLEQAPSGFSEDDCVVATNYNQSSVKAWADRSSADPGGVAPVMNDASLSSSVSLASDEMSAQAIVMNFNSGVADFSLDTSDVGQYSIEILDDSLSFSDSSIRGSSELLTIRPFAFRVTAQGNPGAEDESGPVFIEAGSVFSADVEALSWHASDDLDDDGVPDTYEDGGSQPTDDADFNGALLPGFGNESPAEILNLSSSLAAPSAGTSSGLAISGSISLEVTGFSSGLATVSDLYFPEVGIIQIRAEISGDYLGASSAATQKSTSQSGLVGRFIPSYFEISNINSDDNCGSFSYLSMPRSANLQLAARNTRGNTTTNYRNGFVKLNESQGSFSVGAIDGAVPTLLSANVSSSESYSWLAGSGEIQSDITLSRSTEESGPFSDVSLGVIFSDSDGVTLLSSDLDLNIDNNGSEDMFEIANGEYRSGRLVLPNAHGPESAALEANFITEYWDGSGWTKNFEDNCTSIAAANISFPNGEIDVASNLTSAIGAGSSTATFTDLSSGAVNFISGDAGLIFSAPGAGNTGIIDVSVDLNNYPWLIYDWNQDDAIVDTNLPTAEFTFGSYRGHDRIIFWRELLSN